MLTKEKVTFKDVTYTLSTGPVAEFGDDGETLYCALAFNDAGVQYRVVWETAPEWKASYDAEDDLANNLDTDMCSLRERFGLAKDWIPCDAGDETLACDWENPVDVTLLIGD